MWIAAGVIAVVIGGYFLFRSMYNPAMAKTTVTATKTAVPANGKTVTVNYDGSGFSPNNLTIKAVTTVVWMNNDTDPLQVDSAPHPMHTSYPPLNASSPTQPGNTYTFTFPQAGTFMYHNHLEPAKKGSVTVTP